MKIKVRLSDAGLRDAERQIQEYKTTLNKKAKALAFRLSWLSAVFSNTSRKLAAISRMCYASAKLDKGNCLAFGNDGAGVIFPIDVALHIVGAGVFRIGKTYLCDFKTYGKGNGKRDHWSYYGDPGNDANTVMYKDKGTLVITSGNEPAMAMWGAVEEMASQVEATWREVWSS